jgi:hypothetical protein
MGVMDDNEHLTDEQRRAIEKLERRPWIMIAWPGPFRLLLQTWPLLTIVIAYVLGGDWAPADAGHDYFSAAAQVVPVLLLALAVESRLLSFSTLFKIETTPFLSPEVQTFLETVTDERQRRVAATILRLDRVMGWVHGAVNALTALLVGVMVLVLLSLAEWDCLQFLALPADRHDPAEVSGGILAGLVGVGLIALFGRQEQAQGR